MTDLHTHILPGMDDGARNADESLAMLRMERDQGVTAVVLTPHFYWWRESVQHFLERREHAFQVLNERLQELPEEEQAGLPRMIPGAEVAWHPGLCECGDLTALCIGDTKNMLLELPFVPWNGQLFNYIYDLIGQTGINPVIAHLERYMNLQKPKLLAAVFELGVPVQISAEVLTHVFARGKALNLLKKQRAHILASDCHNCTDRPPNIGEGMRVVRHKLGNRCAQAMEQNANELAGLTAE